MALHVTLHVTLHDTLGDTLADTEPRGRPGRPGRLTARIYEQVRDAVLDGRLAGGDRLPASRELAGHLGVARGTVTAAYDRLLAEGLLESRRGSGTFVAVGCVPPAAGAAHPADAVAARGAGPRRALEGVLAPTGPWAHRSPGPRAPGAAAVDFSVGVPDADLFPLATWRRLVSGALRRGRLSTATYEERGPSRLEAEIARYAGLARSVVASAADVVVTAGAQQALDLAVRVLLAPGDAVAVEDPGYTAAARLLETHRLRVRGVRVDAEGLVVDAIPDDVRLVHVTPSHQHPTGVAMSLSRRISLLQWASRNDAVVVEDDYDSEFRFADRPLEPLQSLDREGRVVYVGSFSKSLLPALRVGYAVAPASIAPALREARRVTVWGGDAVTHAALADFLAEGHHAAHVRRATAVYRERREALLDALGSVLDGLVEVVPSAAGLHVCTLLRDPALDDVALADAAQRVGVFVEPLSERYRELAPRPGFVLGVGAVRSERVRPGVEALARVLRGPGTRRRRVAG